MKKMKRTVLCVIAALLLLQVNTAGAQTVSMNTPRFLRPLVERWATEYQKTHTGFSVSFAQGNQNYTLHLVLDEKGEPVEESGKTTVFFGRYAIMPFTAKDSEAAALLSKKRLNARRLKNLLFEKDELGGDEEDKLEGRIHVYTGSGRLSVARPYAHNYGHTVADYRGKRISGDDHYLNQAVGSDPLALGISTLALLYDLESRQARQDVQLGINGGWSGNATLDEVLSLLESRVVEGIDVEKIGFAFDADSRQVSDFINWVLSEGQQYLHEYALLPLPPKELAAQQRTLHIQEIARR